jgi:hypothetical protein
MINGKSNNISKQIRKKSSSKNKLNNNVSDEIMSNNKLRSKSKNQFNIVSNNINSSIKKIISNEENNFDNMHKNNVLKIKRKENFPSRPPTQQLIKRNPSAFDSAYKTGYKFFNLNNCKIGDFIEENKENNLNKFNKKTNNKLNDLIPFNDIHCINKQDPTANNNAKNPKNNKFRGNATDMSNMLINHNDFDIFNFKKKVIKTFFKI